MDATKRQTVLIVDDEPDVLSYLGAFFTDNDLQVLTARDGKEGLEKARQFHPDLITLDITMPEESGVRMFRNLQDNPETANIPVIVVTGISSDFKRFIETRKHLRPPAGYFEKPVDREKLLAKAKELLGVTTA
jgi:DNA-binding response OmpR family regulator